MRRGQNPSGLGKNMRQPLARAAFCESLERRTLLAVTMLKDIVSGASGSNPTNFTDVGGVAYFAATDAAHGTELWRSDGTNAGTSVIDIVAGSGSSMSAELIAVGDTLYFVATT